MIEFIQSLSHYAYLQNAVFAGLLASVASGIVGSFVTVRRIAYLAGAIAHCTLGGMGAVVYFNRVYGWTFLQPLHGALMAAGLGALVIGLVRHYSRQREDSLIGMIWAVGMAIGLIFLFKTPGYNQDLMSYLFGDILLVSRGALSVMILLDALLLAIVLLYYNKFLAVCFDEEFARIQGVNVKVFGMLLLLLTALTVVLLVSVVGLVMAITLLTLPAAAACLVARRLWGVMLGAVAFSVFAILGGLLLSYCYDLPSGATIILAAAAGYGLMLGISGGLKVKNPLKG